MLASDGDIVRGLGFVALYAAYLEEQIENLRLMLAAIEQVAERETMWPISRRIDKVKEIAGLVDFETRDELLANLDFAKELFERRNEVVHGRIYGGFDRDQTLKSGRPNVPDRPIAADELYDLANQFAALQGEIYRPMIFKIPRALADRA